jgi:hypothetical protein
MESEFKKILAESKKTYKFKLGLAGNLPENINDTLKTALSKYEIVNLSKGKKTPIQERPLDFPKLQNMEVTYFDAELAYPTTPEILEQYVSLITKMSNSHVIARTATQHEDYPTDKKEEPYVAKLESPLEQAEKKAQDHVGQKRVIEILKQMEKDRQQITMAKEDSKNKKEKQLQDREEKTSVSPLTKVKHDMPEGVSTGGLK